MINSVVTSKVGKIFIGDICYALNKDIYNKVWGEENDYEDGTYEAVNKSNEKFSFAVYGTKYGDGTYDGSDGKKYSVDAGVLGMVPIELWEDNLDENELNELGTVINTEKVLLDFDDNNEFYFSFHDNERNLSDSISIPTAGFDDEDEEDAWGDEEDWDIYEESEEY